MYYFMPHDTLKGAYLIVMKEKQGENRQTVGGWSFTIGDSSGECLKNPSHISICTRLS